AVSDLQFTSRYRVPFQFSRFVRQHFKLGVFLESSSGVMVTDMDGNRFYDLTGSYGVNLFGYDIYKECIARGGERVRALGPVLGETYTLQDMDDATLKVLRTRRDIACVLVNPLQALHPNIGAPGDSTLIDSGRRAHFDRAAYSAWLVKLREVCSERGIVLIFD